MIHIITGWIFIIIGWIFFNFGTAIALLFWKDADVEDVAEILIPLNSFVAGVIFVVEGLRRIG